MDYRTRLAPILAEPSILFGQNYMHMQSCLDQLDHLIECPACSVIGFDELEYAQKLALRRIGVVQFCLSISVVQIDYRLASWSRYPPPF